MSLKLKFDNTLEFQKEAVQQVIDLFEWQKVADGNFELGENKWLNTEIWFSNQLTIDESTVHANLQKVQEKFNYQRRVQNKLEIAEDSHAQGQVIVSQQMESLDFTIEMETGTGKTYVYLKTIYELHKTYWFKKFIVVVPSIPIKEWVLKNLEITRDHFVKEYDLQTMKFFVYDSKKPNALRDFAVSNDLRILVMNIQSFNSSDNNIYKSNDKMAWAKPIEYIAGTRPILIIDEPQSVDNTSNAKESIAKLNSLFRLRYSATHKELYNQIYRLTPVDAYDLWLVKKIEVNSVIADQNKNQAFVKLKKIQASKSWIKANLTIHVESKSWVEEKSISVKVWDDLYSMSNHRKEYEHWFEIVSIDPSEGYECIEFSNWDSISLNTSNDVMQEELVKSQIFETVREHFEKEKRIADKWVKVLSLFFLDRVSNYRIHIDTWYELWKYAKIFEEAYDHFNKKFQNLFPYSAQEVHNWYFSQDKKWNMKDTRWDTQADDDTYSLIMKDKEKLLDTATPLRFIFSHSALREWWDNPNVFQICTLNEWASVTRKRQEIWRWLRLPVNQEWERITDPFINKLTVIANESYDSFARALQSEIEEETGIKFTNRIKDARKKMVAKCKQQALSNEDFRELRKRIKTKTRYKVAYDSQDLINKASKRIADYMPKITPPKIITEKVKLDITYQWIDTDLIRQSWYTNTSNQPIVPNVLSWLQSKTFLTKSTVYEIIKQSWRWRDILTNPQMFMDEALKCIQWELSDIMVNGIKYEKIDDYYDMYRFDSDELVWYLNDNMFPVEKSIYDYVVIDSTVESEFAKDLEAHEQVKFFLKLPWWFTIDTPVGTYNPDWAIVFQWDTKLYFVAETKGNDNLFELRTTEKQKIDCGKKHFALFEDVDYKVVKQVKDILTK